MKKHINLLKQKKDYLQKELLFKKFRYLVFGLSVLVILLLVIFFIFEINQNKRYLNLLNEKEMLLQSLLSKKEMEKNVLYFNQKIAAFAEIRQQDVNFFPYYQLLLTNFPFSTATATLTAFDLNNKREIKFTLNFSDFENFYQALEKLEDKKFLRLFERLTLQGISLKEGEAKNYQLTLTGKFIPFDVKN